MAVTANRYCPQCGTFNVKAGNFCRECGSKFGDVSLTPASQHTYQIKVHKQNRLVGHFKRALEEQERQAQELYRHSDDPPRAQHQSTSQHISSHVKKYVRRRDRGRCAHYGSRAGLEYDHIIPASQGGGNTARNVQLSCERCYRQKHAHIR